MSNVIPTRIFDFLIKYPPFSFLPQEEVLRLCGGINVRYLLPDEIIFRQGEASEPYIYIVKEGAVHLYREDTSGQILVDECDDGDLFGLRPLLDKQSYILTAAAAEESLIYAIRLEDIQPLLSNHPKAAWYFAQNFAAGVRSRMEKTSTYGIGNTASPLLVEVQTIAPRKSPITCGPETSVQKAAQIMRDKKVGSIIITNEQEHPSGILTDRDLRNQVVTGDIPLETAVHQIMSAPVITLPPNCTVADVQITMMKNRIHHLIITEDGTANSKISGIISEHDLLVVQGNNPAIFIREIRRCQNAQALREIREKAESLLYDYLLQEVSIHFIANIMSEVNDALIVRAIQLSEQTLETKGIVTPEVPFCWLGLGSEGRQEQLLRTDQDNALIFADVPTEAYDSTKQYFLDLAKHTTSILNECGFEYCPADMMASNPNWCLSLSEWKTQFSKWIETPSEKNVMYCTIFFDFRPVYGHFKYAEELAEHIFETIGEESIFLTFLAKNALQNPPPLTFFRNFVVEKSGEHEDQFDIKSRAMMPLADAARTLILHAKKPRINNTFHRFDYLAEQEPKNRELFQQAADAYEILMRYRALQGLRNKNSGRFFKPEDLTKMERLNLRNSFRPISELQDLLKVRFRLSILM